MYMDNKTVICTDCGKPWVRKNRMGFICETCTSRRKRAQYKCIVCGVTVSRRKGMCYECAVKAETEAGNRKAMNNGHWKGGKTYHLRGYVYVRCPNHPKAWGSSSYVFEHVLVMESMIGRYLNPGETVHHKNGMKDDNRPENLELWASSHPSGQRVDDLVSFALEILNKYAPDKLR